MDLPRRGGEPREYGGRRREGNAKKKAGYTYGAEDYGSGEASDEGGRSA